MMLNNDDYNKDPPLISVAMVVFNGADTIGLAIRSLMAQTHTNWECIVVDDGSSDATCDVLARFDDPRIRLFRLGRNRGRAVARQVALEQAVGDFFTVLDADDWLFSTKLEAQARALVADNTLAAVFCGMVITDRTLAVAERFTDTVASTCLANPLEIDVPHVTVMLRTRLAQSYSYQPYLKLAEDLDFHRSVLHQRQYAIIAEALYCYSEHESVGPAKAVMGHVYDAFSATRWTGEMPVAAGARIIKDFVKAGVVGLLAASGLFSMVLGRRSRPVSNTVFARFDREYRNVLALAGDLESGPKPYAPSSNSSSRVQANSDA